MKEIITITLSLFISLSVANACESHANNKSETNDKETYKEPKHHHKKELKQPE